MLCDRARLDMELVCVLYRYKVTEQYVETNRRADGIICYIKGGHCFDFGTERITVRAGEVLYLPRGAAYTNYRLTDDTEYYEIDFVQYQNGAPSPLLDAAQRIPQPESADFLPLAKTVYDTWSAHRSDYVYACVAELCRMIGMLTRRESKLREKQSGIDRIAKTVSYIEEHYARDTSIEELAKLSSTCVSNLEKTFKKCFGVSPITYRNQVRIRRAGQLLAGGFTIAEAAAAVGFSDSFYFSSVFKKLTGESPGSFARRLR
ncbi:MAG: helix-turn-helix transcriptional regulator [Clostridia bacterium]|nr:helix-turn-helix transcriptional regulator [Clostridia bacterium]